MEICLPCRKDFFRLDMIRIGYTAIHGANRRALRFFMEAGAFGALA